MFHKLRKNLMKRSIFLCIFSISIVHMNAQPLEKISPNISMVILAKPQTLNNNFQKKIGESIEGRNNGIEYNIKGLSLEGKNVSLEMPLVVSKSDTINFKIKYVKAICKTEFDFIADKDSLNVIIRNIDDCIRTRRPRIIGGILWKIHPGKYNLFLIIESEKPNSNRRVRFIKSMEIKE